MLRDNVRRLQAMLICSVAVLCLLTATSQAQTGHRARVWEESLAIPTYELGEPNPYPAFPLLNPNQRRPIYPYPVLDNLTNKRSEKKYRAVLLENEYLRVTVLPELGGKLYAIFDKTAQRDVLYTNHVVKYAMVGIRGAWTSGGVEWNFPDGHTLTTVSPVDYTTRTEADGSAVVVVGDTERVQRMQWAVAIRLRPGYRVVETEVTLNNRREVPGRYWFWATAAAPATADMRFIYPMREAYPHVFWPVFSFPQHNGVDLSLYREVPNALSLFARNSQRDFFGVYYEKSDWGIAHVADHHELPGKKTWTWGNDDAGNIWIEKLTDSDGQYVEFQAGRFETQMEHEFIAPHRVERFTEYWFPVNKLGGAFDEVTRDVALRVQISKDEAYITASSAAQFDDAELIVEALGRQVHSSRVSLSPALPFAARVSLPAQSVVSVTIRAKDGRTLISYSTDQPLDGNAGFTPATPPPPDAIVPTSTEQAYVEGLAADKKSNDLAARRAYHEALSRDPNFAPALVALGLSFYRTGEYEQAAEYLARALRRNRDAGEAHYYLGLVRRAQQRNAEAADQLWWCIRAGYRESVARYVLGEMALAASKPDEAIAHLSESVRLDPRDLKARTVLAMAERVAGRLADAQRHIDEVVRDMPIDYLALSEQALVLRSRGQSDKGREVQAQLQRLLLRESDSALELAFDYAAAGRPQDGFAVLAEVLAESFSSKSESMQAKSFSPLIAYVLEARSDQKAMPATLAQDIRKAKSGAPAYVFPHRVEEADALQSAVQANADDARAAYYLGNVLASLYRGQEALVAWQKAVALEPANFIARRNLARALWFIAEKHDAAIAEYKQVIATQPNDYRLYVELDTLLAMINATAQRIQLLEGAPAAVRARAVMVQALAAAYVDAGRFADAARLLEQATFTSGEGDRSALAIYRRAHIGLARQYQQAGKHAEAAAEYVKATEYPRRFGVGRPAMSSQAREYVAAAREFAAAGRHNEATQWWQRAADEPLKSPVEPGEPWSEHYYYKAVALDQLGRKPEAQALFMRLAALGDEQREETESAAPQGAMRFMLAGLGLKALGQQEQARAAFTRALQLDPRNERIKAALDELK